MLKRLYRYISILMLFILLFPCFSQTALAENDADSLKAKHEKFITHSLELLILRACDRKSAFDLSNNFERNSRAWQTLSKYDDGYFQKFKSPSYNNVYTDGYEKISDTEFKCNAYADYSIVLQRDGSSVTFECAYTFYVRYANGAWRIYDFENIPRESDAKFVRELNAVDPGITVYSITGHTFYGYLLKIDDPSRVIVGTVETLSSTADGMTIYEICRRYNGVAAINGGGFADSSMQFANPNGLVITQGKKLRNFSTYNIAVSTVIGFDYDDKLIVSKLTHDEFDKLKLRDALVFSPAIIADGKMTDNVSERKTYSARTAIGQAADGAVLMLVVDGRQPDSYGANMEDLANVLLAYDCVTAGNLDGGASSAMCLGDYKVTSNHHYDYSRKMPTAFVVK